MKRLTGLLLVLVLSMVGLFPLLAPEGHAQAQSNPANTKALAMLQGMTPEERVGQLFLVTFNGTDTDFESEIYDLVVNRRVGGVILRADNDNFTGPANTVSAAAELIRTLQTHVWENSNTDPTDDQENEFEFPYIPLFIGISQEGDQYPYDQIINGLTPLPNAMAIGATWEPDLAEDTGAMLGKELSAIGFNLFFGPSLDVLSDTSESGDDLGTRTFGGDPYWVGEMAAAYIRGVHAGSDGHIAVIGKHFPGRGESDRAPEEEVATVRKSLEQLKLIELAPFFHVTNSKIDPLSVVDGFLVSHIRYQGFQGSNLRDTTPPVSLDANALTQILSLDPIATWRNEGGLVISDNLGSKAVRRFYDPTEQTFDARLVARNAFLAGNDLLYLDNFIDSFESDSLTTIQLTLESFTQKYREDPAFAERVDESVVRILTMKYSLYEDFTLDQVLPDTSLLDEIGKSIAIPFEVARQSVTLISPELEDLSQVLPREPDPREQLVFFTDEVLARQCSGCPLQEVISENSLKNAVLRLYGPSGGGQINQANLTAYSFLDLFSFLNDPAGLASVGVNIKEAEWIIFALGNPQGDNPESSALKRLLAERSDLLRNKKVVVFAFCEPYFLDATDISKVSAYYGLYSKTAPFIDMAARMLFQELPALGSLPVSVSGVGYDLLDATSPDPEQLIPLYIDIPQDIEKTPTPAVNTTVEPTSTPVYQTGDMIPLRTGVIYDHNGNPVPDGTVVQFIFTSGAETSTTQQIVTTTVAGIARSSYRITEAENLQIRAVSEPALASEILTLEITPGAGLEVTAMVPTSFPSYTPEPSPTFTPTQTATTIPIPPSPKAPNLGDWFLSFIFIWGLAVAVGLIGKNWVSLRWGLRWALLVGVGGFFGYLMIEWYSPAKGLLEAGTWGVLIGALAGMVSGFAIGVCWWRWSLRQAKNRSTLSK